MGFQDKSLKCVDCGATFTFTSGEQEFFATKGYTNEPKRCAGCRRAKKQQNGDSNYSSRSYSTR
ncbi:MAG: zinc-ribbon domain-containing protein [Dehalococcoidia bacterium]|nr:zinc-ribbon domain-containing protein [Dehalococcoidia bacterium]MDD5494068.1 zinc-ribbon domain-containing protein [Dehalococcoidia bacterium]